MDSEVKGNPNPHVPLTQVSQVQQQMHGESSTPPTRAQGWEDEEKWGESSKEKHAQNKPRAT